MKTLTPEWLQSQRKFTTTAARFWKLVEKTQSCWLWTGKVSPGGYGSLSTGSRKTGMHLQYAHRFSWLLHGNVIPENLCVLHRCDVPKCVNPEHLFIGTDTDNVMDRVNKNRSAHVVGSINGNSKLTERQIADIRNPKFHYKQVARKHNISCKTVFDIRNRTTWNHVP